MKIDKPLADYRAAYKAKEDARKTVLAAQKAEAEAAEKFRVAMEAFELAKETFLHAASKA